MRRRLTVAILVLVAATLVVTTLSSYVLVRRAAIATSQQELEGQAAAISHAFTSRTDITRRGFGRELVVIADAGAFAGIGVLRLLPDGAITGTLPSGLTAAELDVPALQEGQQTSGHTSSRLVYTAIPVPIARVTAYTPVLVLTRQSHDPANGLRYFVLVGATGLVIAALVAAGLARRFTRPLVEAVGATRRIASGDLQARVPITDGDMPEFAQLAESINTMGGNLVRAQDQERQFILSVSHELRTPLTSIRGYADAVIDGATDDPVAAARVIASEAGRLERLVQDLLDLARLDAHRFSLDLRMIDAAAVARGVADGFERRASELGLELVLAPGTDRALDALADPDRLAQIMANLVENASSFAATRITVGAGSILHPGHDGGPTGPERAEGAVPAVWVVDDGPGIPGDELTRVFDRHFSSDRVRGRRKGTGLGLAIVAELAAAMGARVEAQSPVTDGGGTGMVLWLQGPPGPEGADRTAAPGAGPDPAGEAVPGVAGGSR
jgi:signal transduction histidine kinase